MDRVSWITFVVMLSTFLTLANSSVNLVNRFHNEVSSDDDTGRLVSCGTAVYYKARNLLLIYVNSVSKLPSFVHCYHSILSLTTNS